MINLDQARKERDMASPDAATVSHETRLELLLENWGRWARYGITGMYPDWQDVCGSAESRYDIPPWPGDDGAQPEPDEQLGEQIESAWRRLPWQQRLALAATYVEWPWSRVQACRQSMGRDATQDDADNYRARRCRMPMGTYLNALTLARREIRAALKGEIRSRA